VSESPLISIHPAVAPTGSFQMAFPATIAEVSGSPVMTASGTAHLCISIA